jgi:hypothetical protein
MSAVGQKQLLHLVFGGELTSLDSVEFKNLSDLDIDGIYPSYAEAYKAGRVRSALSTTRRCGISSSTCNGLSTPMKEWPGRVSDGSPVPAVGNRCCYSRRMIVLISRVTKPSAPERPGHHRGRRPSRPSPRT